MGIQLIVGLGNPGTEYAQTRHNAGFWLIDAVAQDLGLRLQPEKNYRGLLGRCTYQGQNLWLLQPQTFMNASGQSVAALARFFKIPPQDILVAHDELDLPPGEAKLKLGGSHAGHNGLRDIHAQLGSDQYWRLRLGVGHPGQKSEVVGWVLQKPPADARDGIHAAITRCVQALPDILASKMDKATAHIHTSQAPRPKKPRVPTDPPPL
jgi:PTH1 family peptidyl-tRNA hydrolase